MSNVDWTWEDYDYLYRNYNLIPTTEIAKKLNRSVSSVIGHAEKLGLYSKSGYTRRELGQAVTYGKQLGTALIFLLPEYSTAMVEGLMECAK